MLYKIYGVLDKYNDVDELHRRTAEAARTTGYEIPSKMNMRGGIYAKRTIVCCYMGRK